MYFHVFQDPEGQFFSLEQSPLPGDHSEALALFLEQDAFWKWYRFTVHIDGAVATYMNIAQPTLQAQADRDAPVSGPARNTEEMLWRLQHAAAVQPPEINDRDDAKAGDNVGNVNLKACT